MPLPTIGFELVRSLKGTLDVNVEIRKQWDLLKVEFEDVKKAHASELDNMRKAHATSEQKWATEIATLKMDGSAVADLKMPLEGVTEMLTESRRAVAALKTEVADVKAKFAGVEVEKTKVDALLEVSRNKVEPLRVCRNDALMRGNQQR